MVYLGLGFGFGAWLSMFVCEGLGCRGGLEDRPDLLAFFQCLEPGRYLSRQSEQCPQTLPPARAGCQDSAV